MLAAALAVAAASNHTTAPPAANSTNTMFSLDYITSANTPALFGVAIAIFAIASTVFFFIHKQEEQVREQSARDAALEMERADQN